jgi:hypothetical protein
LLVAVEEPANAASGSPLEQAETANAATAKNPARALIVRRLMILWLG